MPKRTRPLTDIAVNNLRPRDKSYKPSDGGGLYLEVLPTGGKSWRMKYRFGGQEKRLTFGLWPDVSLKLARQRRDEARTLVAEGIDPGDRRRQEKADAEAQAAEDANTFEVVARDWHAKQVKVWSEGHAAKVLGRIEQHLFPAFGNVPITALRAPAILPTLREIEAKGQSRDSQTPAPILRGGFYLRHLHGHCREKRRRGPARGAVSMSGHEPPGHHRPQRRGATATCHRRLSG